MLVIDTVRMNVNSGIRVTTYSQKKGTSRAARQRSGQTAKLVQVRIAPYPRGTHYS
jgi:hypothetical protein